MGKVDRLQKIIARSTGLSRRQAEVLIQEGKIFVDGQKIIKLGTRADPGQRIVVKGKLIHPPDHYQYLLFHKPRRCVVTRNDPEGRTTIYDYLPRPFHHLKSVGRLDYDSEGLLLLTNDGELANKLTHPRFHLKKIYEVKVTPKPAERQLERLRRGVVIDGRRTLPAGVEVILKNPQSVWLKMELAEGRNRQIRKMCEKVGLTVKTLVRVALGPFRIAGIPPRQWKLLKSIPNLL